MNLCKYSKSELYHREILAVCPLALNTTEAKHCPCRRREYLANDIRVLTCTFPNSWNGDPIRDPSRVKQNIRTKLNKQKPPKEPPMPTESSTPAATASQPIAAAPAANQEAQKNALAVINRQTMTKAMSVATIDAQLNAIVRMGRIVHASGIFGTDSDAQGMILAARVGGDFTQLLKLSETYHFIKGKLSMRSDAMLAKFASKPKNSARMVSRTPEEAAIELKVGRDAQIFRFTWAEAQIESYVWSKPAADDPKKRVVNGKLNEALLKDNWSTPRRRMQMLWCRVISDGVRAMDPTVNCGTYTADEYGGDAPEISEADIIDAEFTVASKTAEQEPLNAAAGDADVSPSSSGPPAATSSDEGVAEAVAPVPSPEPTPAPSSAADGSPVAAGVATAAQLQAESVSPANERIDLLMELKSLKDQTLSAEQYQQVLAKRGVSTAKDLDLPELAHLVNSLQVRLAKMKAAQGTDELSQWANGVLAGK